MTLAAGAAIKLGLDAIESENLFSVSMGKMEKKARAFSEELQKQFGLNGFEVRKNIGILNTMVKSMGLTEGAAFEVSTGMTQLAFDMASFFNLRPDEAFAKLRAGISGEAEPLKQLGIVISETALKQFAFNQGIIKQGETLTEQQKVLARYLLILDRTSIAQGDLGRTLESPANQLRRLKTQIVLVATELGIALIPVFKQMLTVGNAIVRGLKTLTDKFKNLDPGMQRIVILGVAMAAALGPLLFIFGGMAVGVGELITVMAGFGKVLVLLIGPIGAVLLALAGLSILAVVIAKNWDALKSVVSQRIGEMIDLFFDLAAGMKKWLVDKLIVAFNFWDDIFGGALRAIVSWVNNSIRFWAEFIKKTKEFLVDKFKKILNKFIAAFNFVGKRVGIAIDALVIGVKKGGDEIKSSFVELKDDAVGIFGNMTSGLLGEIDKFITEGPKKIGEANEEFKVQFENTAKTFSDFQRKFGAGGGVTPAAAPTVGGGGAEIARLNASLVEQGLLTTQQIINFANLGEGLRNLSQDVTDNRARWNEWIVDNLKIATQFGDVWRATLDAFSAGFGDAIAGALLFGESFSESIKALFKDIARTIISQLIKIIVAALIARAALAFFGVPQVDVASTASTALSSVTSAIGGIGEFAKGGIVTRPTIGLIGEKGPEMITPLSGPNAKGGGFGQQTIIIQLDGRQIARATVRNMPSILRIDAGLRI